MNKKIYGLLAATLLFTAGCSTNDGDKKTDESGNAIESSISMEKENKEFVYNGLKMAVKTVDVNETVDEEGKEKDLYTVVVALENISDQDKGIGALDFQLIDKEGKKHTISTEMNAFGGTIEPDKSSEEKVFFLIDPSVEIEKFAYIPKEDIVKEWVIN